MFRNVLGADGRSLRSTMTRDVPCESGDAGVNKRRVPMMSAVGWVG